MKIKDISALLNIDAKSLIVNESIRELNFQAKLQNLVFPDINLFSKWLMLFSSRDKFTLSVVIGNGSPINLQNASEIEEFYKLLNTEQEYLEHEEIELKIHVLKIKENNKVSVYDLDCFILFLTNLSFHNLLVIFRDELLNSPEIFFDTFDENTSFGTSSIWFGKKAFRNVTNDRKFINSCIKENCHFGNFEEYKLNPYDFYLLKRSDQFDAINKLFDKLTLLFSIISVFDITSLDDASIFYKLIGYKVFEGSITLSDLDENLYGTYFKIFEWVYCEKSKVADKLGLARNILSLSLRTGSINIDDSAFLSMNSSYQIYQKENINRYIDIRNKITDQLVLLSQSALQVINNYIDNFKKSLFAFLSFFISVLVIRVLSNGSFKDVLSKDATILSLSFLFISFLFLLFSSWEFSKEKDRLIENYSNIKGRFIDLLKPDDIAKILNDDKEFNSNLQYVKRRKAAYSVLWVIALVVFLISIFSISTYINWDTILETIKIIFPHNI